MAQSTCTDVQDPLLSTNEEQGINEEKRKKEARVCPNRHLLLSLVLLCAIFGAVGAIMIVESIEIFATNGVTNETSVTYHQPLAKGRVRRADGSRGIKVGCGGSNKKCGCFYGGSKVSLSSGRSVQMKDLAVGDMVLVSANTFSPILGWLDINRKQQTGFVTLHTAVSSLTLTPSHVVFVREAGQTVTKYARDVLIGEALVHEMR